MNNSNTKRIAKNTMLLYIRMLLIMLVTLYTSRIILKTIGVSDYGIFNVVGGVVFVFTFLSNTMSGASQRYFSFCIGKSDYKALKNYFSIAVILHNVIAIVVIILAETVGLWFIKNKLVYPTERYIAVLWVYQCSIAMFVITILRVPFNALIFSYERMNIYAILSIIEAILKLLIVYFITLFKIDKLILFSILTFIVTFIIGMIYIVYCLYNFKEARFKFFIDYNIVKSFLTFSGWSLFGNISWVTMGQGVNILLNMFYGPLVNAAHGISYQVNSAVSTFIQNFRLAIDPQIVKSHASNNKEYMFTLLFQGAKYSFYLLLLLITPIILETNIVMKLWLKNVPDYVILFTKLTLINTLIRSFDYSFGIVFKAVGKIKENQLLSGFIYLLVLPTSYLFLKNGFNPDVIYKVQIVSSFAVGLLVKVYLLRKIIKLSVSYYFKHLILPIFKILIIALPIPLFIHTILDESLLRFLLVTLSSTTIILISTYKLEIDDKTKNVIKSKIRKILHIR